MIGKMTIRIQDCRVGPIKLLKIINNIVRFSILGETDNTGNVVR